MLLVLVYKDNSRSSFCLRLRHFTSTQWRIYEFCTEASPQYKGLTLCTFYQTYHSKQVLYTLVGINSFSILVISSLSLVIGSRGFLPLIRSSDQFLSRGISSIRISSFKKVAAYNDVFSLLSLNSVFGCCWRRAGNMLLRENIKEEMKSSYYRFYYNGVTLKIIHYRLLI